MSTRAMRLAPAFLAAAVLTFVAGIARSSSLFMLLSLVASAALLVSLGLHDRNATRAARRASSGIEGDAPEVGVDVSDHVAAGVAAAAEARGGVTTLIDLDRNTVTQQADDLAVEVDLDKAMDVEELLATIQGVGPAKVDALAAAFPTPVQLRAATKDELLTVKGVGPALADRIIASVR